MLTRILFLLIAASAWLASCRSGDHPFDAEGIFEADEVIVSSEVPGRLLTLNVEEGSVLSKDSVVGSIDSVPLLLQQAQVEASMNALRQRTMDVKPQIKLIQDQIAAQQVQLDNLLHEKARTERLIKANAATSKQLDDYNSQIELLKKQIDVNEQQIKVQETTVGTQNSSVMSEYKPLLRSKEQIADQLRKTKVVNPVSGTVLTKYAMAGEVTAAGKALYKIADLSVIILRVYITGTQLSQVKLNQSVRVFVDSGAAHYREYPGTISYISDKAEFTPKTIQTKEERANLVYAVKIRVKNDGYLKIGMFGEVKF
jgi:HlyD family secretion protein